MRSQLHVLHDDTLLNEIREGIIDGTLIPATRADCIVCDDLGCEFCPHTSSREAA